MDNTLLQNTFLWFSLEDSEKGMEVFTILTLRLVKIGRVSSQFRTLKVGNSKRWYEGSRRPKSPEIPRSP